MTGIVSCDRSVSAPDSLVATNPNNSALSNTDGPLSEVNIPTSISQLAPSLAKFKPQVQILSPKPDEILADDRVTIKLQVRDMPLFKQPELGLGNHLQVILDKQTYQSVYDLSQPLVFKNLAAGTHTLRVFAARPWHESFKNDGAFDLVTFHILTKTAENNPDPQQPLLTYSRPIGSYGAEPILLDYFVTNPASPSANQQSPASLTNWQVRVTVNEQRFILGGAVAEREHSGAPVYLQGFKEGKNWVRLELIDARGNPLPNVYNDTVEIFTYQPRAADPLARLIRGDIDPNLALTLVDPDRIAIKPTPTPAASVPPTPVPSPVPSAIAPIPVIQPSPSPIAIPPRPPTVQHPVVPPIAIQPSPSPSVKILPPPDLKVVETPKIAPSPVPPPMAPPTVGTPTSNPEPAPQQQRPIEIVKPIPIEIVPPSVAKSIAPTDRSSPGEAMSNGKPTPTPTLTTKPLPSKVPAQQVYSTAIVIVLPQTVIDELIKPVQTPNPPSATAISLPQSVVDELVQAAARQQRQTSPAIGTIPAEPAPPLANKPTKTWQTQTIELFDLARAKIRTFTNTIPAKAQKFGQNMRAWWNETIDKLRQE
ncbi:hypothetical protein [Chamaesiphon sp.]|uniref:hypothetical protein n=1 Tax=Chamaesiphon sp. TaxID=2814140 RepID=UPI003593BC50